MVGIGIIFLTGDWFGAHALVPGVVVLLITYFAFTITGSVYLKVSSK